ncbi:hypothetical protein AAC387_Pa02g0979 [Persea americana]
MNSGRDSGSRAHKSADFRACAVCKHQRKRCFDCPWAPFFPPESYQEFENVHRLFGVNNVTKILSSVDKRLWPTAIETIQFEAEMWRSNPAYGCWGMIRHLNAQIEATTGELNMVKRQLFHHRQQQQEQQQEQEQYMAATAAMVVPPLGDFQLQPPNFAEFVNKYLYSGADATDNAESMEMAFLSQLFGDDEMNSSDQINQTIFCPIEAEASRSDNISKSAVIEIPLLDPSSDI